MQGESKRAYDWGQGNSLNMTADGDKKDGRTRTIHTVPLALLPLQHHAQLTDRLKRKFFWV